MNQVILLAANQPLGRIRGLGPLGIFNISTTDVIEPAGIFTNVISLAVSVMTAVAFIWFTINLFTATVAWVGSGGDKTKLQEAQKRLTTSLAGLILTISAIFITKLMSFIFNIDILDLTNIIIKLW